MPLTAWRFFHSGYCRQAARFAGGTSWRWRPFHAVFVLLEHPRHGLALVDTGYGPEFLRATQPWSRRMYRTLLPVTLAPQGDAAGVLRRQGIDPAAIRTIFITHFHADHVAGLRAFPQAELVCRRDAWDVLQAAGPWAQAHHLFLPELLPADLERRAHWLSAADFVADAGPLPGFAMCDYWQDGSLWLVDLPGHAVGQYGLYTELDQRRWFYVVDASWDLTALAAGRGLPWFLHRAQHAPREYAATQAAIRPLLSSSTLTLAACHCAATQRWIENLEDTR